MVYLILIILSNNPLGLECKDKHNFQPQPLGKAIWLGATDNAKEGSYVWQTSGLPVAYSNWNAGEPNNCCGGENCAEMSGSNQGWNDVGCVALRSALCEFVFSC